MTHFNFLRAPLPGWITVLQSLRVSENLAGSFLPVTVSLAIAAGGMTIEHYRLKSAQTAQAAYRARFQRSTAALASARLYYNQVRDLVALQRRITVITASGDVQAARLARIGDAVPQHAWLTALREQPNGIGLDGTAGSLDHLGTLLHGLAALPDVKASALLGLRAADRYGHRALAYQIMLESGAR